MLNARITLLILCVVAIAASFLLRGRHDSEAGTYGFSDWVKNPDYKRSAAEYFAAREALTVPDDISPAQIQHMVDELFIEEVIDGYYEKGEIQFERNGEAAAPEATTSVTPTHAVEYIFYY